MYSPTPHSRYDAVIVGSGPNGLAAAILLAQAGRRTLVIEAADTLGGGMRSAALTLPGFVHDICSAIHPLGMGSPFMRTLPLASHGLTWIQPELPVAHPLGGATAVALHRSIDETVTALGPDGDTYRRLMAPLITDWDKIAQAILGPLRPPRHPLAMARFGLRAMWPAATLARSQFQTAEARALFAGLAAHAILPLERVTTAAFGFVLGILGHAVGWPLPRGGTQQLANAMVSYLRSLGGELVTRQRVDSLRDLPPARAVLLDLTPREVLRIAGEQLPVGYRRRLENYRYGPGVFKVDWALDGPIPWTAEACRRAGTVHLGPTLEEIARGERLVWVGQHPERPYVIVTQQSLFDPTRAPNDKHTGWAYCHVPNGSTVDMTAAIERQIERFAPGFRDRILARHTMTTSDYERYNANYVGGDINGGAQDWRQLFTRPVPRLNPYVTPLRGVYLCSSATPPGGGVHGMSGYFAARTALRQVLRD